MIKTSKITTALAFAVIALSMVPIVGSGARDLPEVVAEGAATAHIGTYLGGEKGGNAGAAIGGAIGAITGAVMGSYIGSSMGPAGTVFWGWRASSFARAVGGIAGGA